MTNRYAIEGAASFQRSVFKVSDEFRAGAEASRISFVDVWRAYAAVLSSGTASAQVTYDSPDSHQTLVTLAFRADAHLTSKAAIYVLGGGGLRSTIGEPTTITVDARYSLRSFGGQQRFAQADILTIRLDIEPHVPVLVVGAGWQYQASRRVGLTLDVRSHLGRSGVSTILDARPQTVTVAPGQGAVQILGTDPSIYLSNTTIVPSSLNLPLSGFATYRSAGLGSQTAVSGSLFIRF